MFSLFLLFLEEFIGTWAGDWWWESSSAKDHYSRQKGATSALPFRKIPNCQAIKRFAMGFCNEDEVTCQRSIVAALVDTCRGAGTLELCEVKRRDEPFGFINEPPPSCVANCETQSRVNALEPVDSALRYQIMLLSKLPLMPCQELLMHYGSTYDRNFAVGEGCPALFLALPLQSRPLGEFESSAVGEHPLGAIQGRSLPTPLSQLCQSSINPIIINTEETAHFKICQEANSHSRPIANS